MTKRIHVDIELSDMEYEYLKKICKLEGLTQDNWLALKIKDTIAGVAEFHATYSELEGADPRTIRRKIEDSWREEMDKKKKKFTVRLNGDNYDKLKKRVRMVEAAKKRRSRKNEKSKRE